MLIDNAIIVLDNIPKAGKVAYHFLQACVAGVEEVMGALISLVLTTFAVFVPAGISERRSQVPCFLTRQLRCSVYFRVSWRWLLSCFRLLLLSPFLQKAKNG